MQHDVDYGPWAPVFWRECSTDHPIEFGIAWGTAALAVLITLIINAVHERSLKVCDVAMRRQYYLRISSMSRVFALTSGLSLVAPRAWLLWSLLQKQYEALVLSTFGYLLFALLNLGSAAESEQSSFMGQRMLDMLAKEGPQKYFATPPLCCVLAPCMTGHLLTARHLLLIFAALRQYVLATPTLAIGALWAALVLPDPSFRITLKVITFLGKASTLLALYGLFVLYRATHEALHRFRTTSKFVAIKLFLIIALVQEPIIASFFHEDGHEGHDDEAPKRCISGHNLAHFWGMWALAIETPAMALLLKFAFPHTELARGEVDPDEPSGAQVELLLIHHLESGTHLGSHEH